MRRRKIAAGFGQSPRACLNTPMIEAMQQRVRKRWRPLKRHGKRRISACWRHHRVICVFSNEAPKETACDSDWRKCANNEQLVNNYSRWTSVKVECKREADSQARYKTDWPWLPFGTFIKGNEYVTSGTAIAIEPDAQFQNGFGAMVRSRVICTYDLRAQHVISVDISPR